MLMHLIKVGKVSNLQIGAIRVVNIPGSSIKTGRVNPLGALQHGLSVEHAAHLASLVEGRSQVGQGVGGWQADVLLNLVQETHVFYVHDVAVVVEQYAGCR